MTTMIGYWKQEEGSDEQLPWPQPTKWDPTVKEKVVSFLTHGGDPRLTRKYRGFSLCRLCNKSNGSSEHSDGKYSWPSGLAHYVRDHDVELPQEFVNHVLRTHT